MFDCEGSLLLRNDDEPTRLLAGLPLFSGTEESSLVALKNLTAVELPGDRRVDTTGVGAALEHSAAIRSDESII